MNKKQKKKKQNTCTICLSVTNKCRWKRVDVGGGTEICRNVLVASRDSQINISGNVAQRGRGKLGKGW